MNQIKFRTAVLDDLPILYEFEQELINAERPFDETLKPDHINYYDIKAMIQSSGTEVMVATMASKIIGSAYASIRKSESFQTHNEYAYLGFMYVKPEYRGQGINQLIMEELKCWIKTKNISEIRLKVYHENLPAISAYEKAGLKKHIIEMRMEI